jgi:probable phosphoglycerate mutase
VTEIFVVRHGESTWNAARRWQGQLDPPLSERGVEQARLASLALAEVASFDLVVTSQLKRARRTGELLADTAGLELGGAVPDLNERAAGEWEGLTRGEIETRYPGFLTTGRRPDGYENDVAIVERASRALRAVAASLVGRTAVVVSHGGVINALERAALGGESTSERLDNLEGRWFRVEPHAVSVVGARIRLIAKHDVGPAGEDR